MAEQLRILMLGAHHDDNDLLAGGTALKYLQAGHCVRFLSMTNGCAGHHIDSPEVLSARRADRPLRCARRKGDLCRGL